MSKGQRFASVWDAIELSASALYAEQHGGELLRWDQAVFGDGEEVSGLAGCPNMGL
jgi:hypothetical protein